MRRLKYFNLCCCKHEFSPLFPPFLTVTVILAIAELCSCLIASVSPCEEKENAIGHKARPSSSQPCDKVPQVPALRLETTQDHISMTQTATQSLHTRICSHPGLYVSGVTCTILSQAFQHTAHHSVLFLCILRLHLLRKQVCLSFWFSFQEADIVMKSTVVI